MSGFINKSADYSQTMLLKQDILNPMLSKYNLSIAQKLKTDHNKCPLLGYNIPNNGKKYWMLVTTKQRLCKEPIKENYNILYFFNEDNNFCIEINRRFDSEFLFEGYLYKDEFLITDILIQNTDVIDVDYPLRFALVNEILFFGVKGSLMRLNNHLNIGIHPVLSAKNDGMIKIFMANFVHKNEIVNVEKVIGHQKWTESVPNPAEINPVPKVIEKGGYSDVYNVFNHANRSKEGILYVKGIAESKVLKGLMQGQESIVVHCVFNHKVNKWMPVFK